MGTKGSGTAADLWRLTTPPGKGEYQMWRDESADPPALVCQVGSTQLKYHLRAGDDLHAMLVAHGRPLCVVRSLRRPPRLAGERVNPGKL